jgi:hypothetical protein
MVEAAALYLAFLAGKTALADPVGTVAFGQWTVVLNSDFN